MPRFLSDSSELNRINDGMCYKSDRPKLGRKPFRRRRGNIFTARPVSIRIDYAVIDQPVKRIDDGSSQLKFK